MIRPVFVQGQLLLSVHALGLLLICNTNYPVYPVVRESFHHLFRMQVYGFQIQQSLAATVRSSEFSVITKFVDILEFQHG